MQNWLKSTRIVSKESTVSAPSSQNNCKQASNVTQRHFPYHRLETICFGCQSDFLRSLHLGTSSNAVDSSRKTIESTWHASRSTCPSPTLAYLSNTGSRTTAREIYWHGSLSRCWTFACDWGSIGQAVMSGDCPRTRMTSDLWLKLRGTCTLGFWFRGCLLFPLGLQSDISRRWVHTTLGCPQWWSRSTSPGQCALLSPCGRLGQGAVGMFRTDTSVSSSFALPCRVFYFIWAV